MGKCLWSQAAKECAEKYSVRYLGSVTEIIAEEFADGYTSGYTGNYIRVYVKENLTAGKKYRVKLITQFKDGVLAVNER